MTSKRVHKIILPGRNGVIDALRIPEAEDIGPEKVKSSDLIERKALFQI